MKSKKMENQYDVHEIRDADVELALESLKSYISIDPSLKLSKCFCCGDDRLPESVIGKRKIKAEERHRITEFCYEVEPGSECALTVSFYRDDRPVKAKGLLRLTTNRGKLSPTRVELTGNKDKVKVNFKAPDETIKISIRAFLGGFHRGKIHLHLE